MWAAGEREMVGDARRPAGRLELTPRRIVRTAAVGLLAVLALNLLALFVYFRTESELVRAFARLAIVDFENNLPTFFNFALLVGVLFLLALVALRAFAAGDRWRPYWVGLVLIFLLLTYDEAGQLHEKLMQLMGWFMVASGYLYFSWVIPAGIVVFAVGLAYLRFVLALPRPEGLLTILGGSLYLGGALGAEMVGSNQAWQHGMQDPAYMLIATAEEALEMLGLIVFGYALLRLLSDQDGTIRVRPSA
jgi:hypothetical protein